MCERFLTLPSNINWILNDNLQWLLQAREILKNVGIEFRNAIRQIEKKKLEVKVFKTDRSLTGKDKTNRAKRWEILLGDFQFATLAQCWACEKKLTTDLVHMFDFPESIKSKFIERNLIEQNTSPTCCPVTLERLSYTTLATSVLSPTHGISDYQIGHLIPLKRNGVHDGENICWQSDHGNRIQGNLTIDETRNLLEKIANRYNLL